MGNNAKVIGFPIDATAAGSVFGWKCPDDAFGGGVTIHDVTLIGAGTITGALFTYSDIGTPAVTGTIVASVLGTVAAGVPATRTVADGWVDGGEWVVWAMTAGTALANSRLIFQYSEGI